MLPLLTQSYCFKRSYIIREKSIALRVLVAQPSFLASTGSTDSRPSVTRRLPLLPTQPFMDHFTFHLLPLNLSQYFCHFNICHTSYSKGVIARETKGKCLRSDQQSLACMSATAQLSGLLPWFTEPRMQNILKRRHPCMPKSPTRAKNNFEFNNILFPQPAPKSRAVRPCSPSEKLLVRAWCGGQ